jgi:meiotically up-regulated gene 157 (Mug157) protein
MRNGKQGHTVNLSKPFVNNKEKQAMVHTRFSAPLRGPQMVFRWVDGAIPVKPVGLICSMFRPSDDATVFPFLIPSNFFAVVSLRQAATMVKQISKDDALSNDLNALANEVEKGIATTCHYQSPSIREKYTRMK